MIDKETFKKEYIRMMDSMRTTHLGSFDCRGMCACSDCPLVSIDCGRTQSAFDVIETVERWSKEHPIATNADKFKEVFGVEPKTSSGEYVCPTFFVKGGCGSKQSCTACKNEVWKAEYKAPKKEEAT